MTCGYGWGEMFVGICIGAVVMAGLICWFLDWSTKPIEEDFLPSFLDFEEEK